MVQFYVIISNAIVAMLSGGLSLVKFAFLTGGCVGLTCSRERIQTALVVWKNCHPSVNFSKFLRIGKSRASQNRQHVMF